MKQIAIGFIVVIAILSLAVNVFLLKSRGAKNDESLGTVESGNLSEYTKYLNKGIPTKGYVPDAITARKLAEAILYSIYGESLNKKKPFIVKFDEKNQVWIVEGQLPQNYDGGIPYIIIQKSDGKILAVWHTK